MRILANTGELTPVHGISVHTLQVTRELARRGHHIDLLYLDEGPHQEDYARFCDSMQKVPRLDVQLHLRRMIRDGPELVPAVRAGVRTHPDVLYVNRYLPLPWAVTTSLFARAPVVCTLHGFVGIDAPAANRVLGKITSRFLCVSKFVRERFVQLGGNPRRTDVVYNGIDQADYPAGGAAERTTARAELDLPADPFLVMFFGRVVPDKGIATLVEALENLGGSHPVELLVVGPEPDEAFATRIFSGCRTRIHRLPLRTDVVTPLHASDLVVVPSEGEEAFGRTVIEALSTGRPVLASAVGGIPEIMTDDFAQYLFPPGDAGALTAKVRDVLPWREREPELANACTEHVLRHFSKQSTVDAIEEHLADVVR